MELQLLPREPWTLLRCATSWQRASADVACPTWSTADQPFLLNVIAEARQGTFPCGPWHSHVPAASPSCLAPAATQTERRSNSHVENSVARTRARRHMYALQASVNYEALNPSQNSGDFINHKNDEIIATSWDLFPSFNFIPSMEEEPWFFLIASLEASRHFSPLLSDVQVISHSFTFSWYFHLQQDPTLLPPVHSDLPYSCS